MAKRKKNGKWSGMVGNVSLYELNGTEVARARPTKEKEITPNMAVAQGHFAYVQDLIRSMKSFTDIGFKYNSTQRSAYNSALSVNLNNYKIARREEKTGNLAWMELSEGILSNASAVTAELTNGTITLTWEGLEKWTVSNNNDYLMVAAYNQKKQTATIDIEAGNRKDCNAVFRLHNYTKGDVIDVFVAFRTHHLNTTHKDSETISKSKWVGQFSE